MGQVTPLNWKSTTGIATESGYPILYDISSEMTRQSNRLAKQCGNWQVSKFTIAVSPSEASSTYVALSGRLRFLKPTAGKIMAIKKGRSAWYKALKAEGMSPNKYHDFRVTPLGLSNYANSQDGITGQVYPSIPNLSTLDGVQPLSCMTSTVSNGYELFTTHNAGLQQIAPTTTNMFHDGLITRLDTVTVDTDFVMDEEVLLPNSPFHADTDYTTLSFVAHYDQDQGTYLAELDAEPNLYFSLLNGWFEILFDVDDSDTDGDDTTGLVDQFHLDVTAFVRGVTRWNSSRKRKFRFNNRRVKKVGKMAWRGYKTYRKYRR